MKIITVSREYGSGGREFAEKLAAKLGFQYYDRNILGEIAKKTALDETFVKKSSEKSVTAYPSHFGRSSFVTPIISQGAISVAVAQRETILSLAKKGDAVFVGRAADVILREFKPFNIFVYADKSARVARCREKVAGLNELSDKEIIKRMTETDKERAKCREMFTEIAWGDKSAYHLMINTTGVNIDAVAGAVADYVTRWFDGKSNTTV